MNLLWFINRVFSIPHLLRTLFSPWHRMVEEDKTGFDLEKFAEKVVVNLMSRLVGAVVRIPIIILGVFSLISAAVFGLFFYIFWAAAPAVICILFLTGLYQIIV